MQTLARLRARVARTSGSGFSARMYWLRRRKGRRSYRTFFSSGRASSRSKTQRAKI
jgi:hypothetical protein